MSSWKIDQAIRDDRLIGIDAGKDPPVARIARINMYLHGDGGSRIYSADALDKKVRIPSTASPELRGELGQLRAMFSGANAIQVDVVLTNPPFSMKKEAKEADQREILQEYEAAFTVRDGQRKLRASLLSKDFRKLEKLRGTRRIIGPTARNVLQCASSTLPAGWILSGTIHVT